MAEAEQEFERMTALGEESLAIAREAAGEREITVSLYLLGTAMLLRFMPDRAAPLFEESLALTRKLRVSWGIDRSLQGILAVADFRQDYDSMAAAGEERLRLNRELGYRQGVSLTLRSLGGRSWGLGYTFRSLGMAALHRGDYERARMLFEERLALNREVRFAWSTADTLTKLARLSRLQCQHSRAKRELRECLGISQAIRWPWILSTALGRPEPAARMLAAAQALHRHEWSAPWLSPPPDRDRIAPDLRAALGEAAFATAWAEGAAMSLEEAIAFGIEEVER
jgi:tetratricopeptide (TPR) repeat protein